MNRQELNRRVYNRVLEKLAGLGGIKIRGIHTTKGIHAPKNPVIQESPHIVRTPDGIETQLPKSVLKQDKVKPDIFDRLRGFSTKYPTLAKAVPIAGAGAAGYMLGNSGSGQAATGYQPQFGMDDINAAAMRPGGLPMEQWMPEQDRLAATSAYWSRQPGWYAPTFY
jgi:hypothetical protein